MNELVLLRDRVPSFSEYPFSIPAIRNLETLKFHPHVTFLVGENGTGKSTLLESIAYALRLNVEGGNRNTTFETTDTNSELFDCVQLIRSHKTPKDIYFLRAESFYNVATLMDEVGYLQGYGGKSLHAQSHGESFLAVLTHKLRGNGVYLFDEPESALSPTRQMSALSIIHRLVEQNSQLVIATHSPILLAYPNSTIYLLTDDGIEETTYKETEHYTITRDFLNKPEKMLRYLLNEDNDE